MIIPRVIQLSPESMQVSGFYGPGAWAAWIITMFASWIPLLQADYTHNLHFIGYAMYTNWAAIDLIRHGIPAPPLDQHDLSDQDRARFENIAASIAVVQLGVYQVVMQLSVCHNRLHRMSQADRSLEARRRLILSIGAVLPLSMGLHALARSSISAFNWALLYICCIQGFLFVGFNAWQLLLPIEYKRNTVLNVVILCDYLILSLGFVAYSRVSATVDWRRDHIASLPEQCYYVPCAPQGIGEWDQAFSLIVALFLFLYEFGYDIFRIGREVLQGMWTIWQRIALILLRVRHMNHMRLLIVFLVLKSVVGNELRSSSKKYRNVLSTIVQKFLAASCRFGGGYSTLLQTYPPSLASWCPLA